MTISAQAADGTVHNFPDGTDPSVVDKVMKDYATGQKAAPAEPDKPAEPAPKPLSQLDMLGTGVLDPVYGTAQLGTHVLSDATGPGPAESMDAWMRRREEDIRARAPRTVKSGDVNDPGSYDVPGSAPERGGDPDESGRVLGNLISPMTWGMDAAGPALRALGIMQPAAKTLAVPGLLKSMGTAAAKGGAIAAEQPVTTSGSYAGEKSEQVAAGAVPGAVLPVAETGARWAINKVANIASRFGKSIEDKAFSKALERIYRKMTQDIQGGGPTAQDMLDIMSKTPGKPLTLGHVGGENTLGLIGRVQRQPGVARQEITKFLEDTDKGATSRLNTDVTKGLASETVGPMQAVDGLREVRKIQGQPLWAKATAGGSIAPLKDQFQSAWVEVGRAEKEAQQAVSEAQKQITQATAKQQRAGNDVYLVNSANQELREAQIQLQSAQAGLAHQSDIKQQILGMLNDARDDIANNTPGAVWSPLISDALRQPEIKQGIQTGIKLERQAAFKERRPMNIGEYAITGYDENGDAVIGKVPTMKLLAAAKEGLDSELEKPQYRDEFGNLNKAGVHLDGMRRTFLDELDRLNPDYKKAREVWSGDTAVMSAVRFGEKGWTNKSPEEIRAAVADMTDAEREFARLGVAANLRHRMYAMGGSGNEARAVAGDKAESELRQKIRPFFKTDDEYQTFIDSVDAENLIFSKKHQIKGGSITAGRLAEDTSNADTLAHAAGAGAGLASGHHMGAAYHLAKLRERMMGGIPEDVATQIGHIVSDPAKSLQVIGGYKPPVASRIPPVAPYLAGPAAALTAQELGLQ